MLQDAIGAAFRSDKDWARPHELVIYGAGLAGVSAAIDAVRRGMGVTLVDADCDLLWEISRAYGCVTRPSGDGWDELIAELEAALPPMPGLGFPAWAEIAAARLLAGLGVRMLFFARPIGAHRTAEGLSHVVLATKSGPRTLAAGRFLDASEAGPLAALAGTGLSPRAPRAYRTAMIVSAEAWRDESGLEAGGIATERVLRMEGTRPFDDATLTEGLARLKAAGGDAHLVATSSFRPLPVYGAGQGALRPVVAGNLVVASPGRLTGNAEPLESRIHLGRAAAALVAGIRPSFGSGDAESVKLAGALHIEAEVAVLGAGTGGAVAAIAAARGGAKTVCADLNRFPGGTATGSGIHSYWYGVGGGLQEEVDDLVQALAPMFGAANQTRGYHPEAKRLAFERLFARHGVRFERNAMLFAVRREEDRIVSCSLAAEDGIVEIAAPAWIDGTGDGDLAAMAGAAYRPGRESDSVTSPYTQSAVKVVRTARRWYLGELNFDSGWVDPADPGDLTRARLVGMEQLVEIAAQPDEGRLVTVSPMVGLRQARQIDTEYTLSLDDLIRRRAFDDAVTQVGAHFDNHMLDYQLESREAIFWVWCAHQWRTPVASQLPLKALRPRGLANVLLACRALGVSRDAHHAIRMMRDMQRLGEAAGTVAAASAGRLDFGAALGAARKNLLETGALFSPDAVPEKQTRYGPDAVVHFADRPPASPEAALADLRAGQRTAGLWTLFRDRAGQQGRVRDVLTSNDPQASWLAACIAGLWGDTQAETRLLAALEAREVGDRESTAKYCTDPAFKPFPPDWVVAISVLRECGSARSAGVLTAMLDDGDLGVDVRVAVVRALGALAARGVVLDTRRIRSAAAAAVSADMPGLSARPQQSVLLAGEIETDGPASQRHDMRWKLLLAFAELLDAAGIADARLAAILGDDPRAIVRNAYRPAGRAAGAMEAR